MVIGFLHTSYIQLVCSSMGILGNREKSLRNRMDQGIPGVESWSSRFVSDFSVPLATNESRVLMNRINDPRCTLPLGGETIGGSHKTIPLVSMCTLKEGGRRGLHIVMFRRAPSVPPP